MASKFGGKQAIGHHWAMQQNMARQKSILAYAPRRQPKPKAAPTTEAVPPAEAAIEQPKTPTP